MSDDRTERRFDALMGFILACIVWSSLLVVYEAAWKKWAVEHGAAHYNQTTGEWTEGAKHE